MEDNNLKEMMGVGGGGIAAIGVNQDGTPYNAGGNPLNKFGEPGVLPKMPQMPSLLKRNTLLPNGKERKPLRTILDPNIPNGRV